MLKNATKECTMSLPEVVSPEVWRTARVELLAEEKAMTKGARRAGDEAA